ncbi:MAG: tetratricopeptide repeat protein [Litorimonas sp.]
MVFTDVRGLKLTTSSSKAVEHFNDAIAANAEYRLIAVDHIQKAIEADPNFTYAHCVLGCFLMGAEVLAPEGAARACLEAAEATNIGAVTERERASVAALRAWVEKRQDDAIAIWDQIMNENPTDLFTLQLLHYRNFWLGNEKAIRDSVGRHFNRWSPDMPNYSNVLGMYCFGVNENGDHTRALELGRKAIDMNKDDLWAVHAVAHVLNDVSDQHAGISFMDQFDKEWSDRNAIREHLWWHEALFYWELADFDHALKLYDEYFAKNITPFYLDVQNSASMLWRFESVGIDVGNRWSILEEAALKRVENRYIPFTDIHVAMILGRNGNKSKLSKLIEGVRSDNGKAHNARLHAAAETDLGVCEAIEAYCSKDYARAVEKLIPIHGDNFRPLGASNAQRDVLGLTLGIAALKSKDYGLARGIFSQRLEAKPGDQMTWLFYANASEQAGDKDEAVRARARAASLPGSHLFS